MGNIAATYDAVSANEEDTSLSISIEAENAYDAVTANDAVAILLNPNGPFTVLAVIKEAVGLSPPKLNPSPDIEALIKADPLVLITADFPKPLCNKLFSIIRRF